MKTIRDRLWEKAVQQRLPLTGAFELLPLCNLQCKMCYVRKTMGEVRAMGGLVPTEEWLDLARQAQRLGTLFPLITGGEPFLHPDFQKILSEMLDMGMQASVNTNGTLIDASMAKFLSEHRPTRINMTLYGASPETYEALCGDGNAYDRMRRGVELLKSYDIPLKFNTSITPYNLKDMEAMIAFAKSVNSPVQVATYMFPPVRRDAAMVGHNDRLDPEQAGYARVLADWLQNSPEWFQGQARNFSHFMPVTEETFRNVPQEGRSMNCRAGRSSFWLDWQGNLGNCGMHSTVRCSVREHTMEEAWKIVVEATENLRYAPACASCPNSRICHACMAMVHNECGGLQGRPEYLCKMNEASAKYYQEFARGGAPVPGAQAVFDRENLECAVDPV